MTKTATFSTGYTDTYKGNRDVKAAWAIVFNGEVLASGHSLDAAKARKTAESNVSYGVISTVLGRRPAGDSTRPTRDAARTAFHNKFAREQGFANWAEAYAAYQADAAKARDLITIEVVDL